MSRPVRFRASDVVPARVLNEDDDFITLEVAKRPDVTFHFQMNDEGEVVGGDRFFTIAFFNARQSRFWKPWEEDPDG